jgi:catechol 2,3-dioxygenase-like lactoylglutathione lyase family enzyme
MMSKLPSIRLDHCVIHVSDWARSNAFYRDVMGAELIDRGVNGWAYQFGDVRLNCHGPNAIAGPYARIPVPPGGSDLCFEWGGTLEEVIAHLAAHSVAVELGPVPRAGARGTGGMSVYFRDPDGSLLEFIVYPG